MAAYYNEIEPFAADWLEALISEGLIASGEVDRRDIKDVAPGDLRGFTQCHFFAGIGVWSYALRRSGWRDDWPVWTGSCPCQPFSSAGRRKGNADERHLWPHWFHLIQECRPRVLFGEQVASKDGLGWLDLVQADLEGAHYACGAVDFCAAGVGAPHWRQRLYFGAQNLDDTAGPRRSRTVQEAESSTRNETRMRVPGPGCGPDDVADDKGERRNRRKNSTGTSGRFGAQSIGAVDGLGITDGKHAGRNAGTSPETESGNEGRPFCDPSFPSGATDEPCTYCDGSGWFYGDTDFGLCGCRSPSPWDMAHDDGPGRKQRVETAESNGYGRPVGPDDGHDGSDHPGPTNGFWELADWLYCRDGKWRPVEPGTFPLVDGAAARMGRLRGYGNALVSEQAIAFITAFVEALVDFNGDSCGILRVEE